PSLLLLLISPSYLFPSTSLFLSFPSSSTFSFHLNTSSATSPLLSCHTLHALKPTQSTSPYHLHHTHLIPKRENKSSLSYQSDILDRKSTRLNSSHGSISYSVFYI